MVNIGNFETLFRRNESSDNAKHLPRKNAANTKSTNL
jgi:hypothetical protein